MLQPTDIIPQSQHLAQSVRVLYLRYSQFWFFCCVALRCVPCMVLTSAASRHQALFFVVLLVDFSDFVFFWCSLLHELMMHVAWPARFPKDTPFCFLCLLPVSPGTLQSLLDSHRTVISFFLLSTRSGKDKADEIARCANEIQTVNYPLYHVPPFP